MAEQKDKCPKCKGTGAVPKESTESKEVEASKKYPLDDAFATTPKLDSPELKEVIRDVLQDYDQYSKCVHRALIDGIEPLIKDARGQERKRIKGLRDTIYRIMQDNTELTEQLSKSVKWDREKVAKKLKDVFRSYNKGEWVDVEVVADQLKEILTGGN